MADSPHRKTAKPLTTLGGVEPDKGRTLAGIITVLLTILVSVFVSVGGYLLLQSMFGVKFKALDDISVRELTDVEINRQSLDKYQELTQRQAASSYRIAQVSIFIGFLMLIAGAYYVLKVSDTTAQIIVGALAALGSAISGYIGATSIRIYQRAQAQMNFYYAQPLVQSYILQAQRLSDFLSSDRRDAAYERIIDQTLEGASVAGFLIVQGQEDIRPLTKRRKMEQERPN